MDIDNFKSINDRYGHQVGDDVIVFVAATLKSMSRKSDLASRFGGEEFIGMLPETDLSGAYNIAEKVRIAIEKKEMQTPLGEKFFVTVSIGVSLLHKESDTSVENIIQRADDALYEAKNKGKNITCTHA
jgi:diguanylate cyclase (GGDEF)-like protein